MKDQDEFIDDELDDDIDDGDEENDSAFIMEAEDDEMMGEEADGPSEVRTVLLSKNGMLALLSLKTSVEGGMIVRIDPRQPLPVAQQYEDDQAATMWFKRSLATSKKHGWMVEYDGEPLWG